jgi:WD40 repeat protein
MYVAFSVAFLPNGNEAVAAGRDVVIFDLHTRKIRCRFSNGAPSIAVAADGSRLFFVNRDKHLEVRNVKNGELVRSFRGSASGAYYSVAVSSNGKFGLAGEGYDLNRKQDYRATRDYVISLWNLDTGEEIAQLTGHRAPVRALAFLPHEEQALSYSEDGAIILWDLNKKKMADWIRKPFPKLGRTDDPYHDYLRSFCISPDKKYALLGLELIDLTHHQMLPERFSRPKHPKNWASAAVFTPDGRNVVIGYLDGRLRLWDFQTGKLRREVEASRNLAEVYTLAISPDGKYVLSGGLGSISGMGALQSRRPAADHYVRLWRLPWLLW